MNNDAEKVVKDVEKDISQDLKTVPWSQFPRTTLRGVGQVMFQDNMWTGILFLCGIFWGAYMEHFHLVAWGCLVGVLSSTLAGYILKLPDGKGAQGLWGFNGALVGCAFPTFLGETWAMWISLVFCAAMSTWVRSALDNVMGRWGVSSLTFPFVISTYIFLLAARYFYGMPPTNLSSPELLTLLSPEQAVQHQAINMHFGDLVLYWLRGISQVFLINSWVTGIFFLAALAVSSIRAAIWAAIASALSLFIALCWHGPGQAISEGLYGFSAVLTGIALGATFCNFSWRAAIWCVLGIIATVFVQAAMNAFFSPMGLPTLTGPFCITTWFFLFPAYKMFAPKPAAS